MSINIGDIVSYSFMGVTKGGIPIRCVITRNRFDLKWEDVLKNEDKIIT